MAEERKTFPYMSERNWWAVRRLFKQRVPGKVDTTYVTTRLGNMTAESARANVTGPLKGLGLLNDQGEPTDLAHKWHFDNQYKEVCDEIRSTIYPQALLDTFPEDDPDPQSVQDWFKSYTRKGEAAAEKMARMYLILVHADPTKETETPAKSKSSGGSATTKRTPAKVKAATDQDTASRTSSTTVAANAQPDTADAVRQPDQRIADTGMSLHIDLQIHISPEASADQIDQIFASMAKHLPLKK